MSDKKVAEIQGYPVTMTGDLKFRTTVSTDAGDVELTASSLKQLETKVTKTLGEPIIKAIHVGHTYWITQHSVHDGVKISGSRVFRRGPYDKKFTRVKPDEYFHWSPEVEAELDKLYKEYEDLEEKWKGVLRKAGRLV